MSPSPRSAPAPARPGRGAPKRRTLLRPPVLALATAAALLLAGCSGDHNMLGPHGPDAGRVSALSWFMFSLAALITLFVFTLLVIGLFRDGTAPGRRFDGHRLIIYGGLVMPVVVLLTLSGLTVAALRTDPGSAAGDVDITVIGHQYWWEVRYPSAHVETANEIHVPVGRTVRLTLRSADVIHSFWVPALAGKTDMIPGRTNHMSIRADDPGTYRGQCAELCGLQHAKMAFTVVAQPQADYERWLAGQARPAATPSGDLAVAGRELVETLACAGCHTVRGTSAAGTLGPDLTHVASRSTIGALTLPTTDEGLRRWIVDVQGVKPGALMPEVPVSSEQVKALVAYLRTLR